MNDREKGALDALRATAAAMRDSITYADQKATPTHGVIWAAIRETMMADVEFINDVANGFAMGRTVDELIAGQESQANALLDKVAAAVEPIAANSVAVDTAVADALEAMASVLRATFNTAIASLSNRGPLSPESAATVAQGEMDAKLLERTAQTIREGKTTGDMIAVAAKGWTAKMAVAEREIRGNAPLNS